MMAHFASLRSDVDCEVYAFVVSVVKSTSDRVAEASPAIQFFESL
jgi:hypothetical protein